MTDLSWMNVPGPNGLTWAQENAGAPVDLSWMNVPGPDGLTWAQKNAGAPVDLSWLNNMSEFERATMVQRVQNAQRTAPTPAAPVGTDEQKDAMAQMRLWLGTYGLGSLAEPLWKYILDTGLSNEEEALLWIQDQPDFQKRFPAFKALQEQNRAITTQQYIELERNYVEVMRNSNVPQQFFDNPDDFTDLIKNNVSAAEFQDRIQKGYQRVAQAAPEVRTAFKQYFGVDGDAALAAFFIDPDRSSPALMKAAAAAEIGAAALQSNTNIDLNYATKLSNMGISYGDALDGLKRMEQQRSLFSAGINESAVQTAASGSSSLTGNLVSQRPRELSTTVVRENGSAPSNRPTVSDDSTSMSKETQLGADFVFGTDINVQRELQMRLAKRKAQASGTSQQVVANREGQTAIGTAD
jgi:hypothetical protein